MSGNFQSSYTGAQLDAAIASYVNRSTGTITLDPDHLAKSLGAGYYSGVSATFNGTGLTATANDILLNKTAVTSNGKVTGAMQSGDFSITLNPSNLSQSVSLRGYVTTSSASLDYSSLTASETDVASGKTFIGVNGTKTGSMTLPQFGSFDVGNNTPTSYTISGINGTPTNIMILKPGWQGKNDANIGAMNRFVCVPGGAVDRYHYAICGFNGSPSSGAGDYTLVASTSVANCVSWNRSNGSVTITLPKLRLGDTGSLNKQSFFRQTYCWVVW